MIQPARDLSRCELAVTIAGNLSAQPPEGFHNEPGPSKAPFDLEDARRFVRAVTDLKAGKPLDFEFPLKIAHDGKGAIVATIYRRLDAEAAAAIEEAPVPLAFAEEGVALVFVARDKIYLDPDAATYTPLLEAYERDLANRPESRTLHDLRSWLRYGGGEGRSRVVRGASESPRPNSL